MTAGPEKQQRPGMLALAYLDLEELARARHDGKPWKPDSLMAKEHERARAALNDVRALLNREQARDKAFEEMMASMKKSAWLQTVLVSALREARSYVKQSGATSPTAIAIIKTLTEALEAAGASEQSGSFVRYVDKRQRPEAYR